ncbi:MAG TPA: hypothetical protein VLW26_11610 [Steroidobacteraceae bacterium]|nr:hypothetical protein [Steroidobacteraceae bacterium]
MRAPAVLAALIVLTGGVALADEETAPPAVPSDAELEAAHAVIGRIAIDNQNIFNPNDKHENTALYRAANHLHVVTRASVIRKQLLFHPGEPYSRRLLEESERILRLTAYIYDAFVRPVAYHDGRVDILVTTRDVWTLDPGFNYGRSGGTNSTGVQIEDLNLLGTGTKVAISQSSNVDRTSNSISMNDPHAFSEWTGVQASYTDASDGSSGQLNINRPFYALNAHHAEGVDVYGGTRTDSLYDLGEITDQFREHYRFAEGYYGWSEGLKDGWVRRYLIGATFDEHRFDPAPQWSGPQLLPQDRKLAYPWVEFDLLQDQYLKLHNHDQILRTEDFYIGTFVSARIGWSDTGFGADRDALMFKLQASQGISMTERTVLLLSGSASGRIQNGVAYNTVAEGLLRFYYSESSHWLFYSTFDVLQGTRLDLDNQILLGGDSGLRGYPLRYQTGTARALLRLEQRYYTDWYPLRLFRVGGAVFFDAGRTWGSVPLAPPPLGVLSDAGFGLRLGNARSGLGNVIHIDVAFPLQNGPGVRRAEFLVETQVSF